MSCNGNHFLSCRIDSVWKMFFYYLLGNSDLPKHAQLIYLSMAQTYITIPTYSHYCTDHFTSLHKQTTSRNTLSTLIIRPQYNQQYKYQHPAEIRVPTWSREYWFVKSVNLAQIYITYWKHMEIVNVVICYFRFSSLLLMAILQKFFALCSKNNVCDKCYVRVIISSVVLLQYEKCFIICWGTLTCPSTHNWFTCPWHKLTSPFQHIPITAQTILHHSTNKQPAETHWVHSLSIHTTTSYGNTNIQWKSGFAHDLVSIDLWRQWIWTKFALHIENIWKL